MCRPASNALGLKWRNEAFRSLEPQNIDDNEKQQANNSTHAETDSKSTLMEPMYKRATGKALQREKSDLKTMFDVSFITSSFFFFFFFDVVKMKANPT